MQIPPWQRLLRAAYLLPWNDGPWRWRRNVVTPSSPPCTDGLCRTLRLPPAAAAGSVRGFLRSWPWAWRVVRNQRVPYFIRSTSAGDLLDIVLIPLLSLAFRCDCCSPSAAVFATAHAQATPIFSHPAAECCSPWSVRTRKEPTIPTVSEAVRISCTGRSGLTGYGAALRYRSVAAAEGRGLTRARHGGFSRHVAAALLRKRMLIPSPGHAGGKKSYKKRHVHKYRDLVTEAGAEALDTE